VFVASGGGDFSKKLKSKNITHVDIPILTKSELHPKVLISSIILLKSVKRHSIDMIHANTRVTQILAFLVSGLSGVPFVTTCHGFFRARFGRRLFGAWGAKTIAISEAVREHLVNDFKMQKEDIELVYNGISLGEFRDYTSGETEEIRKEYCLDKGPVVGTIARLSPVKGHKYLLQAMKDVIGEVPSAQLLIIGDGPIKSELVSFAKELGIDKRTHFVKSVFGTARPLSIMDVFALPSVQEGLGLSIIEALAMRRAVVASDVGGVYTVIKDDSSGVLVPPRDSKALGCAVIRLLKDSELRSRFAHEGRELVERSFSLDHMAERIEKCYEDILKGP